MRVLIVCGVLDPWKNLRNAVIDYLEAFGKYDKSNDYYFLNMPRITSEWGYSWIKDGTFDVVLFTCTFLGIRWDGEEWKRMWDTCEKVFAPLSCRKVLMPQDDYNNTAKLWDFCRRVRIDEIFSINPEIDHDKLYPVSEIGNIKVKTILTGYIDEKYLNGDYSKKNIDVIYRARKLPYKYGRLGQYKAELVDVFSPKLDGLKIDIKNTINRGDTYTRNAWIEHLGGARCVLGCIGGSSVMDKDGELGKVYDKYLSENPEASYEEAKNACFPNLEENLHGMISPRIFEAAITRTCQVLIRADYSGVLRENVDYIPIDEDYGNIDEVIEKIKDEDYCREIAENCYQHVVESGKYTYRTLVNEVMGDIGDRKNERKNTKIDQLIRRKCKFQNFKVESYISIREIYGGLRRLFLVNP